MPALNAGAGATLRPTEDRNGRIGATNGSLTLSQPIFNASTFPQYSQASHQRDSEKWGAIQDRRIVAFDAARAFLQILTAETVLDAAKHRLERARANVDNSKARAAAELVSVNDTTRQSLEMASAYREVATSEGNVARARITLEFLTLVKIDQTLREPEPTTDAAERFETTQNQVTAALSRRPDVLSTRERTLALEASAREPLYRLFPSLNLQGQMRLNPTPAAGEVTHEETVTASLAWAIFDGGFRYADRRTRLAQAESQRLDESYLRRSVDIDVRLALASLRAARDNYHIAEDAMVAAKKNTEETEILYRQGLARAIELTDANARRYDAEVSRASAKLSMEQAYLELRYTLGLGPLDDDPSVPAK